MIRALAIAVLLLGCIDPADVEDGEGRRREARRALFDRLELSGGARLGVPIIPDGGPSIVSLRMPLGVRAGQIFSIGVARADGDVVALHIGVDGANANLRAETRNGEVQGLIRLLNHVDEPSTTVRLLVAAEDASGRIGTPLDVPFDVREGGGTAAGNAAQLFVGEPAAVEALDLASDLSLIAGDAEGVVTKWEDSERTLRVQVHAGPVFDVRRVGERIVSAGADGRVVALLGEDVLWERAVHEGPARALDVAGDRIVSGGRDGDLVVLSAEGNELLRVGLDGPVVDLDVFDDGERVAVALGRGSLAGGLAILELDSGNVLRRESFPLGATAVASTGETVGVAVGGGEVRLLAGDEASTFFINADDVIEDLVFSGNAFGAMTLDGRFVFWKPQTLEVVVRERFEDETFALAARDGSIAFGDRRGAIWLLRDVDGPDE
ncbi:MAG: hypothetical protein AAF411_15755 [Myxococcota bacterium]